MEVLRTWRKAGTRLSSNSSETRLGEFMTRTFRLGLFIVATLLILAVGVFLIGNNQLRFQPTYRVKAEFQNVVGLSEGGDVRVGGIHKGTIKLIDLPREPD